MHEFYAEDPACHLKSIAGNVAADTMDAIKYFQRPYSINFQISQVDYFMNKKAIVLLSGGLDSTTCLAMARAEGFECYALSFDFGQKHRSELQAAKKIAAVLGAKKFHIFKLPIGEFGGSALTDDKIAIQDYSADAKIPATYVPARNTIFLSVALGWAEIIGASDIFIGVNALDYSGYPDCRPEYIAAFQTLATLATKASVENKKFNIRAPLIHLNKAEIVKKGIELGIDYSMTVSCYRADKNGLACGTCASCVLRKKGFQEINLKDPTQYIVEK